MPVEKFRSVEEMNAAPARAGIGNAFERFVRHCARSWIVYPRIYPRGVFKYRSIEEAQRARTTTVLPRRHEDGFESRIPPLETPNSAG